MTQKNYQHCALILIAESFNEPEAVTLLSTLRQAGICVKCVGLRSGLVRGAHGIWLMPDLTLDAVSRQIEAATIQMVVLPDGEQVTARLNADPRVHRLLRQVVGRQGYIVTSGRGIAIVKSALVDGIETSIDMHTCVLRYDTAQSLDTFLQTLVRQVSYVRA